MKEINYSTSEIAKELKANLSGNENDEILINFVANLFEISQDGVIEIMNSIEEKEGFNLNEERFTDTSNITVGTDAESDEKQYYVDIVYDSSEERCPDGCDVENLICVSTQKTAVELAEKTAQRYNLPINNTLE